MEKNNNSIWLKSAKLKEYAFLNKDISVDVCIIGGGITGISTAYYLSKHGINVAIVEMDKICSKTTGHTTGKITSQHNLFYKYLLDVNGKDYAKKYLDVNEYALKNIEEIIQKENISCDFEEKNAFVFTNMPEKVKAIKDEVNVVNALGKNAEFIDNIDVPIKMHGAIKLKNQAQFNPVKYVQGLCESMDKSKVQIYEKSKVIDYKKENSKFKVKVIANNKTHMITTSKIVVATRYPIFNFPGMYFIKNYQELEYAMCVKVNEDIENYDMYVSCDTPAISFRTMIENNQRYLLVVREW